MGVGLDVDGIITEVGTHEFLHAFFSTISQHLEQRGWGTRFPELMNELYDGRLPAVHAQKVLDDIVVIRHELAQQPPQKVVWDIENLSARPPWGDAISEHITSLANYFVTSTGRDLFDVLVECLQFQKEENVDMVIVKTPPFRGGPNATVLMSTTKVPKR